MRLRLTGTFVLVFGIFVFAGSALAGNGNGNASDGAPGNSASAPGQVKKEAPPAATDTTVTTTTVADQSAAPTDGVKPSSETAHDTPAPASSDETKLYGNGQTAGAIAVHHGASPSTVLHGPGNSQPHKAAPCSGGHEVDVHALKSRRAGACGSTPPQPTPTPTPTPAPPTPTTAPVVATSEHKPPTQPNADPSAGHRSGDAAAQTASHSQAAGASHGVLAGTRRVAELPFTGERLWIAVLAGLVLIGTGLGLRQIRTVEAAAQSRHDDTDRSRHPARDARAPADGRAGR